MPVYATIPIIQLVFFKIEPLSKNSAVETINVSSILHSFLLKIA